MTDQTVAQLQNALDDRLEALDACELAEHDRDGYRLALERERAEHRDTRRALELVKEDRDDAVAKVARADRMVARLREQITAAHDVLGARMDESLLSCCQRTANRLIQWEMRFDRDYGAEWLGPCAHGCPDSADCAECESLPLAEVVIRALRAEAKRAMDAREECARLSAANAALTDEIDRLILDRAEWMRRVEEQEAMQAEIERLRSELCDYARERLPALMSEISEDCWCAGWLHGTEDALWKMVEHGAGKWGPGEVTQAQVDRLKRLSDLAGGWFAWRDGDRPEFVPMERWVAEFAKKEGER